MKKLFLSLLTLSTFVFFSCDKEEATSLISSEEEAIISNDVAAEAVIESVDYEVDLFSGSSESIGMLSGGLKSTADFPWKIRYRFGIPPSVTVETTDGGYPVTITLDYGEGKELLNGTVISGIVSISISAPPRTNGAVRTVTFSDFYVDDVNITGTRTATLTLSDETGVVFNLVANVTLSFSDGTSIERTTEKTRSFVEGFDTPEDYSDDVMNITGYVSSVSSEGYVFSSTIIEPLVRLGDCRYIVQGIVLMEKNDEVFAELNFGDGTCDDIATITKDGEERQITIGKRHRIRNI